MDFRYFAGSYADSVFRSVGLLTTRVRYLGIEVTCPVFDQDTISTSETSLEFMEAQNFRRFDLVIDKRTFDRLLSNTLTARIAILNQQLASGDITAAQFAQQEAIARFQYSPLVAISPNQIWEIQEPEVGVFQECKVTEQGLINVVRYEVTLAKLA